MPLGYTVHIGSPQPREILRARPPPPPSTYISDRSKRTAQTHDDRHTDRSDNARHGRGMMCMVWG